MTTTATAGWTCSWAEGWCQDSTASPPRSFLLRNRGGRFEDATPEPLQQPGMVTCALWSDLDGDGRKDLVVAGEWMTIRVLANRPEGFADITHQLGLEHSQGWWGALAAADLDGDGVEEILAGNAGGNLRFKPSPQEPLVLYAGDLDGSGRHAAVLGYSQQGRLLPVRDKAALGEVHPLVKKKFTDFAGFAAASLEDIYGQQALEAARRLEARELRSVVLRRREGKLVIEPLPAEAQFSAVEGLLAHDFDGDGQVDVLLAGNRHATEVNTPRSDASLGLLLIGDGRGGLRPVPYAQSGFYAPGDARALALLRTSKGSAVLVANNDHLPQLFTIKQQLQPANQMAMKK